MCKYCESKKSEHFLCDSCGNGMCDDCYDSDIEHINHTYMDICESEEEEQSLEEYFNGSIPCFLCVDCYALFKKQTHLMPS